MKKRIKWNPRFITSLFIAFMCTLNCMAQNVIKGSVNDGSGEPLPGVSVAVKGTTSGTITDLDGKFSINARNNDVLIFSYVGMNTQDIKVNNQRFISVTMKDDVASLDEVVVVGTILKTWKHHCSNFYRIGQRIAESSDDEYQ